jgi:hypothetical protein
MNFKEIGFIWLDTGPVMALVNMAMDIPDP